MAHTGGLRLRNIHVKFLQKSFSHKFFSATPLTDTHRGGPRTRGLFLVFLDQFSLFLIGPSAKEGKGPTKSLLFVRSSGAFRKNHSLEFSEILHGGLISFYYRNNYAKYLKIIDMNIKSLLPTLEKRRCMSPGTFRAKNPFWSFFLMFVGTIMFIFIGILWC